MQPEVLAEGADGELTIRVLGVEGVNYALAHNAVPVVYGLTVTNSSGEPVTGLSISLRLEAPTAVEPARPWSTVLEVLPPGEDGVLRLPPHALVLDPRAFATLDEAIGGLLRVDVQSEQGHRIELTAPIRLLARDEWWARAAHESLVAFVQPRDPAVRQLLTEAATVLHERTGDPSLEGYQSGPVRAVAIADAIYTAMQRRQINYINPPASFEGTGQKIRPPREVLVDRFGTCLDLATTYAACAEAAGLHPVLVIADGHAFPGVLTREGHLPEVVVNDPRQMAALVDSGLVVPVEATALTAGKANGFDAARRERDAYWSEPGIRELRSMIDVAAARRFVKPLPTLVPNDTGGVTVLVEERAVAPLPAVAPAQPTAAPQVATAGTRPTTTVPPRVQRWCNSLLDLSLRNPLLNFRPGKTALALHVPAHMLGRLEDLVHQGHRIQLAPHDQLSELRQLQGIRKAQDIAPEELSALLVDQRTCFIDVPGSSYVSRLRTLRRRAQSIVEESGSNDLYLTLGSLEWDDAGRSLSSPLFLLPVKLDGGRRGQPFTLQIEEGGYAVPNQCLVEKLRGSFDLDLVSLEEPLQDEAGIDVPAAIQAIRLALVERNLPFRIEETAHVGILQFGSLRLWKDLRDSWPTFLQNPVVRHLVETPTDSFTQDEGALGDDVEAAAYCPIAADGSQLAAVRAAAEGQSFVLEGPPGTGKSQTITNLIANLLAEGKSVLFVAEKQAALDVVKRRLASVGLGAFCLDLHGKEQTPAAVRAQLKDALHTATDHQPQAWEALRARHAGLVKQLTSYRDELHAPGPAGLSAWSARQLVLALGDGPMIEVPSAVVRADVDVDGSYRVARELSGLLGSTSPDDVAVWRLAQVEDFSCLDQAAVVAALTELAAAHEAALASEMAPVLQALHGPGEFVVAEQWERALASGHVPDAQERQAAVDEQWPSRARAAQAAVASHLSSSAALLQRFAPTVLYLGLDALLAASVQADGKLLKGGARKQVEAQLAPHLRPGVQLARTELTAVLRELLAWRAASSTVVVQVQAVGGLGLGRWSPFDEGSVQRMDAAVEALTATRALLARVGADVLDAAALRRVPGSPLVASRLRAAWSGVAVVLGATSATLNTFAAGRPLVQAWQACVPAWHADAARGFLGLNRWCQVESELRRLEAAGLGVVGEAVLRGDVPAYDLEEALRRGVARAALQERLQSAGLSSFDGLAHDRLVDRYAATAEEVRDQMGQVLPAQLATQRGISPDRLLGKVGALNRELSKQRGGLSIRGLVGEYGQVIRQLTPCLMTSPASAARFLPPGAIDVDVVVFDEASQIRVAEAIGAMGRARSVVVVGDSKQMPPSAFGEAAEDPDAPAADLLVPVDMESVLSECVESNLPRHWLSWHYRSEDERLIAFSNTHYYEGRLSSFPGPPAQRDGRGVSLLRVDGAFERGAGRVNRAEAAAVVDVVRRRLAVRPEASIGVVTFNTEQRDLVLDLLEECGDEAVAAALVAAEDPLFVKNLENVQGDERDVILFSLAFSKDPVSGRLPLNFGPLNRVGGERRLNVAVTRARREVIVVASFDPSDIDLSRTSSIGLAHLKSYLEAAGGRSTPSASLKAAAAQDLQREQVAERLRREGLLVALDVGLSDFTVDIAVAERPEGPWVAVLLDGMAWSRRRTVGDRDGLPKAVLQRTMGWHGVVRVWLPSWLAESEAVVDRVRDLLRSAPLPASVVVPEQPSDPAVEAALLPASDAALRGAVHDTAAAPASTTWFEPMQVTRLVGTKEHLNALGDPRVRAVVQDVMGAVVTKEGPVEAARLARLTAAHFGLQRVRAERVTSLLDLLPTAGVRADELGTFVWPVHLNPATVGYRATPEGVARPLEEIAPEEIAACMRELVSVGMGIAQDELLRLTAEAFGIKRQGVSIRARLEAVLAREVAAGRVATAQDGCLALV